MVENSVGAQIAVPQGLVCCGQITFYRLVIIQPNCVMVMCSLLECCNDISLGVP